ncbi:MAG: 6,7-dimethyl-8-ribityllumazine synthase [Acidobacteria bacterium]|nr:6,7-dimethyl-8-ribityllumazine synthase [Acidobacteriota bacterium]
MSLSSAPASTLRVALVVSRYHEFVTSRLESGARAVLRDAGVSEPDIVTFHVPGAYELAQAAHKIAAAGGWDAVVCVGCLIRGETSHFDLIASATAEGIMRAAQATGVPIAFGVLTTNTADEAMARAVDGPANKGRECAEAALAMVELYRRLAR